VTTQDKPSKRAVESEVPASEIAAYIITRIICVERASQAAAAKAFGRSTWRKVRRASQ
jgi:hypothetical protein